MPRTPHFPGPIAAYPALSSTLGNSTLRIVGSRLDEVVAIMVDNAYVASFRRINPNAITIVLGPTSPGTHTVRVVRRNGEIDTFSSCATVEPTVDTPVISLVTPLIDKYDKCDAPDHYRHRRVFVEGTNFTKVSAVFTDGVSRKFRIVDATHLEYQQPRQTNSTPQDRSQRIAARDAELPVDLAGRARIETPENLTLADSALIHASDIQLVTSDGQASEIFQLLALQPPRSRCHHPIEDVVVGTLPIGTKAESCRHVHAHSK